LRASLRDRHKISFIENLARAHGHHLDETQDQIASRTKLDEGINWSSLRPRIKTALSLNLIEPRGDRRFDPVKDLPVQISSGDLGINIWI